MAQSVKRPTSVQVMISRSVSSSPVSGSVLTAQSLEPALDSVSPSLSAPPMLVQCLSLSKINKHSKKNEILPFAPTLMELEGIMLSEISQSEKDKYHMTSLI